MREIQNIKFEISSGHSGGNSQNSLGVIKVLNISSQEHNVYQKSWNLSNMTGIIVLLTFFHPASCGKLYLNKKNIYCLWSDHYIHLALELN